MRVALVQMSATTDKPANLAALSAGVAEAARAPVDLVVLPEGVMHDFGPPDQPLGPVAEPLDGPFVSALERLARAHGTTIVAGMFESTLDPQRVFNTLVAVDGGGLRAVYRKTHLYDSFGYRESDRLVAAEPTATVLQVGGLTLGLMTCYDLRFPEMARLLVDAGADTLVVPAAWVAGPHKVDHWQTLLRARAIENTSFVVAAAQCGRTYCGHSSVVDPMGQIVTALADAPGVVLAELQPRDVAEVRRTNPALAHRQLRVCPEPLR